MKHKGRSALRDKVLWVMGLVSKVNTYPILTLHNDSHRAMGAESGRVRTHGLFIIQTRCSVAMAQADIFEKSVIENKIK